MGGREALSGELPWVVHLSLVAGHGWGWGHHGLGPAPGLGPGPGHGTMLTTCTGTLITPSAVLTAAHCLERAPGQAAEYVDYVRVSTAQHSGTAGGLPDDPQALSGAAYPPHCRARFAYVSY